MKMNEVGPGLSIAGNSMGGLEAFVTDSNEALSFKLLRSSQDAENEDINFPPEMTHQIFGDNENVFGYRDLKIDMWMCASTLKTYLGMSYAEKIDKKNADGVEADPVIEPLIKILAEGQVVESKEALISHLESDKVKKFVPHGSKIDEFQVKNETFVIHSADDTIPGFREYHAKLQPWIMFFIDAASYIDVDDANWRYYLLFEKYKDSQGLERYAIAGYATVYQYYAYPANIRPRISQFLVLPPFQKRGLGSRLLNAIYKNYHGNEKVVDITVEDPSDEFVRLRDFVDTKNCMAQVTSLGSLEALSGGFTENMAKEANEKLKLCKRQVRRIYEIARLRFAQKAGGLTDFNDAYKDYRIDVKKRLNLPFLQEERKLEKLKKSLKPEEFAAATLNMTNKEQRLETLQSQFKDLEEHYLHVLEQVEKY